MAVKKKAEPKYTVGWATQKKKCPECKRHFDWLGEQWVYKTKHNGVMRYYCSWTCWRKEDRQKHKPNLRGENCK